MVKSLGVPAVAGPLYVKVKLQLVKRQVHETYAPLPSRCRRVRSGLRQVERSKRASPPSRGDVTPNV